MTTAEQYIQNIQEYKYNVELKKSTSDLKAKLGSFDILKIKSNK